MTNSARRLEPIYGNGWASALDGASRDTPEPFCFAIEPTSVLRGVIITDGHEFGGATVELAPRYPEPTDIFSVTISRGGSLVAYGYAQST